MTAATWAMVVAAIFLGVILAGALVAVGVVLGVGYADRRHDATLARQDQRERLLADQARTRQAGVADEIRSALREAGWTPPGVARLDPVHNGHGRAPTPARIQIEDAPRPGA